MPAALPFDVDLFRRYSWPGRNYLPYPPASQFQTIFGGAEFRDAARLSNGDPIPRRLSLSVQIPFRHGRCSCCGDQQEFTNDTGRFEPYLARLVCEIALVAPLFDLDRDVIQLHLGGGTSDLREPALLSELLDSLSRQFHFSGSANRDFSIELDSSSVTPGNIEVLAFLGFNIANLRVQNFDPATREPVSSVQSMEEASAVIEACRRHNFRSVNVDLFYGLPGQDLAGFGQLLNALIANRPDRLTLCDCICSPPLFAAPRHAKDTQCPSFSERFGQLQLAIEKLADAGYCHIGMAQFVLPNDQLAVAWKNGLLHRNTLGFTAHPESDLIGLGVAAVSHIGDTYSQNALGQTAWEAAVDAGRLPVCRGINLDADDLVRVDAMQQLVCSGEIDVPALENRYGIHVSAYFHEELGRLSALAADGVVEIGTNRIKATPRGRWVIPAIAACFDHYLYPSASGPASIPE